MASAYAHKIIAERALSLSPALDAAAREDRALYLLGAQGPDFAFFCRGKGENAGRHMHRNGIYAAFSNLLDYCSAHGEALPWALGLCSHYAADVIFHGYIYPYLKEKRGGRTMHAAVERAMDKRFASLSEGRLGYGFLRCDGKEAEIIAAAFNAISGCAPLKAGAVSAGFCRYRIYLRTVSALFSFSPSDDDRAKWDELLAASISSSAALCGEFLARRGGKLDGGLFLFDYLGNKI